MPKGAKFGGRKKGTPNKLTVEKRKLLQQLCPNSETPIELWLHLLRNPDTPIEMRLTVARDVAPYMHPKLASIEARSGGATHEQRLEELLRMAEDE